MLIAYPSPSLKAFILLPYFLLLIAGLTVPSDGSHGFFSIKSLSFIGSVLTISGYALMVKRLTTGEWKIVCFMMGSIVFLIAWMTIGLFYGETPLNSSWEHFKIMWLTISVVAITVYLIYEKLVSLPSLFKTVIVINFIYSLTKVGLVFLHLFGMINLWAIVDSLGIRFMSMDIFGTLPRFQTSIDIVTPFLLFFFLQSRQFGITWSKMFKTIYLAITPFAIFLSFSRFLILITFVVFFLHILTLKSSSILRIVPILFAVFAIVIGMIGVEGIYSIIERRFFSSETFISDLGRKDQIDALMGEFSIYPILGKGLGGYAPESIRDTQLLYSYEVQWVAALMQFGLVGLCFLLAAVGVIGMKFLSQPLTKQKLAFFILFLSWLASGFTNPFLLSLTSGIIYSLFFLAGVQLKNDCSA